MSHDLKMQIALVLSIAEIILGLITVWMNHDVGWHIQELIERIRKRFSHR